jgi:hypothetical protein
MWSLFGHFIHGASNLECDAVVWETYPKLIETSTRMSRRKKIKEGREKNPKLHNKK